MTHIRIILCTASMFIALSGCDSAGETEAPPIDQGTWQAVQSTGNPLPRHENAYTAVGSTFYLLGGRGDRPVQAYDPLANTWETLGLPPLQMHHFQAVSYRDRIFILSAFTGPYPNESPIPNIYIYDPATDNWTMSAEIPEARRRGSAGVVVHEDQFYIVGGIRNGHIGGFVAWLDRYDPLTGEWTALADAPHARDHFQAAVLDGKLYAAGGRRTSAGTDQLFDLTEAAVDVYDFAAGSWSTLPSSANLPTERAGTTAIAFRNRLVVLGGESTRRLPDDVGLPSAHSEVEAYDPATQTWTALPPMIRGRHGTQALVYDDKIYIAAGSSTLGATEIDTQEVYVP